MIRSRVDDPVPVLTHVSFSLRVFADPQRKQSVLMLNDDVSERRRRTGPESPGGSSMSTTDVLLEGCFWTQFRLLADVYQALHFVWYRTVTEPFKISSLISDKRAYTSS